MSCLEGALKAVVKSVLDGALRGAVAERDPSRFALSTSQRKELARRAMASVPISYPPRTREAGK